MNIRFFQPDDAADLVQLFTDTVHQINIADYSLEQVEAWAPRPPDLEAFRRRLGGLITLVAQDQGGELAGFAAFKPDGHFDLLYVHQRFQRQGVASALCSRVEQEARKLGVQRLFTEASITARPFFERRGFGLIAHQTVERRGVRFRNYRMEKAL